jgi:hypothetical protein
VRRALGFVVVAAVGAAVFFLWPQPRRTPEDEVRLLVARAVAAAEKGDAAGVTEQVADEFHGSGVGSKQELKQYVLGYLLQHRGGPQGGGIAVLNPSLDVAITSPTAASFTGSFVFAGDGASRYEITAEMEKRRGDWVVTSASWKQL